MEASIPMKVRLAALSFGKRRADYYSYLASMLQSSKGGTKILTLFERDAQRYEGNARGVLCAYWSELYQNNGGNLGDTWTGTLPDHEVAIIRVSQDAGDGALQSAFEDMARVAKISDKVKRHVRATLAAAIIGLLIAVAMVTVFPIFSSHKLQEIYSFIPLDEWGPRGKAFVAHAERVTDYGLAFVLAVMAIAVYLQWSIDNLTGRFRDWLDTKTALFGTIRDIKGALFLSTMSTLTRKRGNVMFTLRDSLRLFAQASRSPWLRWRVQQIVDGIDQTGAVNTEAFRTPILSFEMFHYLQDVQEARGFAEGFEETGRFVEGAILESIISRLQIYRWVLLLFGVATVIGVVGYQFSIIYEMKGVMLNYYSSK